MKNNQSTASKSGKPFVSTSRSLPIALLRARETIMAPIRVMLQESNISEQRWRVLRVVEEAGEVEQTAIAAAACLQLPSLTRILRSMESDGLVTRKNDVTDRRSWLVSITPEGEKLIDSHRKNSAEILSKLRNQLGVEKTDRLLDTLEEISDLKL